MKIYNAQGRQVKNLYTTPLKKEFRVLSIELREGDITNCCEAKSVISRLSIIEILKMAPLCVYPLKSFELILARSGRMRRHGFFSTVGYNSLMISSSAKIYALVLAILLFFCLPRAHGNANDRKGTVSVPILLYHRFGPLAADSMTVTTPVFESHLKYLRNNGYTVIPLRRLVDHLLKQAPPPPPGSVVIVVDDGHKSVYTDMLPLIMKYRVPVTLFIYPSAISNASYAMTWDQLREIKRSGLADFQSHSYWHPNFKKDKKKMIPEEYDRSVQMQLRKSKEKIEKELDVRVDMLAWPFGIYDDELARKARESGYIAAFSIERRHAGASDGLMSLPRYLLLNSDRGSTFEMILKGHVPERKAAY